MPTTLLLATPPHFFRPSYVPDILLDTVSYPHAFIFFSEQKRNSAVSYYLTQFTKEQYEPSLPFK